MLVGLVTEFDRLLDEIIIGIVEEIRNAASRQIGRALVTNTLIEAVVIAEDVIAARVDAARDVAARVVFKSCLGQRRPLGIHCPGVAIPSLGPGGVVLRGIHPAITVTVRSVGDGDHLPIRVVSDSSVPRLIQQLRSRTYPDAVATRIVTGGG